MITVSIKNRTVGEYSAVWYPDGKIDGDMRPIIYDAATIELSDSKASFILGYKESKNLFGLSISYTDIINVDTGESFSFQVNNIYLIKIIDWDPKVIARVGEQLRYYENFWSTEWGIEPDWDKKELTPLGYYEYFLKFDEEYFYPLILRADANIPKYIDRFFDYYGFRSYDDEKGGQHFILLIEDKTSSEDEPIWYFVDNFSRVSETLDFGDDSEVETWTLDGNGTIIMTLCDKRECYIDASGHIAYGKPEWKKNDFEFVRYFEDTDADVIVGKNDNGVFLVDAKKTIISDSEKWKIRYFSDLLFVKKQGGQPIFVMKEWDEEATIIDKNSNNIAYVELSTAQDLASIEIDWDLRIVTVVMKTSEIRKYPLVENAKKPGLMNDAISWLQ